MQVSRQPIAKPASSLLCNHFPDSRCDAGGLSPDTSSIDVHAGRLMAGQITAATIDEYIRWLGPIHLPDLSLAEWRHTQLANGRRFLDCTGSHFKLRNPRAHQASPTLAMLRLIRIGLPTPTYPLADILLPLNRRCTIGDELETLSGDLIQKRRKNIMNRLRTVMAVRLKGLRRIVIKRNVPGGNGSHITEVRNDVWHCRLAHTLERFDRATLGTWRSRGALHQL